MGLSRRLFTKEFKLAAVRRLEQGVSIAEVARGLEVNPTCCTGGAGRCARVQATGFLAMGSSAGPMAGWRNWNGRSVSRTLEIDFLKGCLQRIEEQRMLQALAGNPPSSGRLRKK